MASRLQCHSRTNNTCVSFPLPLAVIDGAVKGAPGFGWVRPFLSSQWTGSLLSAKMFVFDNSLFFIFNSGRRDFPSRPVAPAGPIIEDASGIRSHEATGARTFTNLLQDQYDELQFEYLCTSQVLMVKIDETKVAPLPITGLVLSATPSPNGRYLLVSKLYVASSR